MLFILSSAVIIVAPPVDTSELLRMPEVMLLSMTLSTSAPEPAPPMLKPDPAETEAEKAMPSAKISELDVAEVISALSAAPAVRLGLTRTPGSGGQRQDPSCPSTASSSPPR